MLGYVKHGRGAGAAALGQVPVPEPGPGQALVQVAACGICGSDLHAVRGDPGYEWVEPPVVLGHEFTGTVVGTGPGVAGLGLGDPVVAVSIQGCGRCATCRSGATQLCPERRIAGLHHDGGLAEYAVVGARHLVAVPAGLDLVEAALTEPLSVAVHAVGDRAGIRPGDRVVVSGPGTIGLLCGRLALLAGADVMALGTRSDAAERLPLAARLGLDAVEVDGRGAEDAVRARFGVGGPDRWIEASGAIPALEAAVRTTRRGGTVTVVAMFARPLTMQVTDAVRSELTLACSYASAPAHYQAALEHLADGSVDAAALLHRFGLGETPAAFAAATRAAVVKPLILPDPPGR
jgi:L-iditol 2-dehydrogenase